MGTFFRIVFFILLGSNLAFGQITVRLFNYRPTGELGYIMKPLFSAEIGFQQPFEERDRIRSGFSITFLKMNPRMAAFPTYGRLTDGSGTRVIPGEQSFQKYNLGILFGDMDFAFVQQDKFNIFFGGGIVMGLTNIEYTYKVPSLINESFQGASMLGGLRFRVGAEYIVNDNIGIIINANRSIFLVIDPRAINWANDYGVGVRYLFD